MASLQKPLIDDPTAAAAPEHAFALSKEEAVFRAPRSGRIASIDVRGKKETMKGGSDRSNPEILVTHSLTHSPTHFYNQSLHRSIDRSIDECARGNADEGGGPVVGVPGCGPAERRRHRGPGGGLPTARQTRRRRHGRAADTHRLLRGPSTNSSLTQPLTKVKVTFGSRTVFKPTLPLPSLNG